MVEPKDLLTAEITRTQLDTKDKVQKAAADLQVLMAQPGWILIEKVLKFHIDNYGNKILNDDTLTHEAEGALKQERAFLLLFKSLPDGWVKELMNPDFEAKDEQDDPFA